MVSEPLPVRLSGERIGELREDGGFEWDEGGLRDVPLSAPVLSHSLPFGGASKGAAPFFGGLLPEGLGLERLARESRVVSSDLYGLLAEVGADVSGSVTIGEPRPPLDPLLIEEQEFAGILERAHGYLRGSAVGGGGSSATGVQPKVALTWDAGSERWMIGRGTTPSTHLLKPVHQEQAATIHAEAYLNSIARSLGLSAHDAWVESAGSRVVLVVERYDRIHENDGKIVRLHQEDAAQALGLPWGGNDKYESVNPGANLRALAALLDRGRSVFSTAPSDRERLLALVTLNTVAGNTDAHAKNFSLMLPSVDARVFGGARSVGTQPGGTRWVAKLADAYDLVPQSLFAPEQSPYAMRIGGESQPNNVTSEHLCTEAESWGMRAADAERVVVATLAAISESVAQVDHVHAGEKLPRYLNERLENLQRGDRVWVRQAPPALW